jgi:tetratricopeptide (TPR) repeat protein
MRPADTIEELAARAWKGEREAFDVLIERHVADLRARITRRLGKQLRRLLGDDLQAADAARRALGVDSTFTPAAVLLAEVSGDGSVQQAVTQTTGSWQEHWLAARRSLRYRVGVLGWQGAARCRDAYGKLIEIAQHATEPYAGLRLEAYLGRGVAQIELGETDLALLDLGVARYLAPSSIEPALLIGKAHLAARRREAAEDVFLRLFDDAEPMRREEVAFWVSLLCAAAKEWSLALDWADRVASDGVRSRLSCYLHWRRGDTDYALVAAREATRAAPSDAMLPDVERLPAEAGVVPETLLQVRIPGSACTSSTATVRQSRRFMPP